MSRHVDITETAEAQRLNAAAVEGERLYNEAAAKASDAWVAAGRPEKGGYFEQPHRCIKRLPKRCV
jgi:hypothetical protein